MKPPWSRGGEPDPFARGGVCEARGSKYNASEKSSGALGETDAVSLHKELHLVRQGSASAG